MTYDTYLDEINRFDISPESFPHCSNIVTKCHSCVKDDQKLALKTLLPAYIDVITQIHAFYESKISFDDLVKIFNVYYEYVNTKEINGAFSHQSDFLSSIVPELICSLVKPICKKYQRKDSNLFISAQRDIIIECNFDVCVSGNIILKRKRMDIAILLPLNLKIDDELIDFSIPLLCAEVKTNIDKNMLSGIEASVETLKRTFPNCGYYAIGEFSDFAIDSLNYASTKIDEILILRNQKRSEARHNASKRNPISSDVLAAFLNEVDSHLAKITENTPSLSDRMRKGRLI